MSKICVVGSLNMDKTMTLAKLPQIGETLEGQEISDSAGGKGFNQAVAAARLGSEVVFIGAVGDDENGRILKKILKDEHIDDEQVEMLDTTTGIAWILIEESGKNMILTYAGANKAFSLNELKRQCIADCDIVISQFEIAEATILSAFKQAKAAGKTTILNPAPGKFCKKELLELTDYFMPNETEFDIVTNHQSKTTEERVAKAKELIKSGIKAIIITLGEAGSLIITSESVHEVPAVKAKVIDTTAAGDSYIGTFAHFLAQGASIYQAAEKAAKVAAKVVEKYGAYTSLPTAEELNQ
ncbi:ribokinase [Listeria sp. PSOL-1]|uniref:ribokinase n=1 Tax=Listeria sp. PSOL-1 TaxID=1844999 RepID=UPI0013D355B8|nr:ribokinase [Listeria sp. PSOL-1]